MSRSLSLSHRQPTPLFKLEKEYTRAIHEASIECRRTFMRLSNELGVGEFDDAGYVGLYGLLQNNT